MKNKIFRIFAILIICIVFLTYGILIGKYRVFPYSMIKKIQDNTEETEVNLLKETIYSNDEKLALISVNPNTIDSIRIELKKIVLGEFDLYGSEIKTLKDVDDPFFKDIQNLKYIEQFTIVQNFNIQSIGYIFHPTTSNERGLFYHQGHSGGFELGKKSIAFFLKNGFTVYAFSMPLKGKNNRPVIEIPKIGKIQLSNHEEFKYLDQPIKYFISPVITMLNYAELKNFKDISMVGVSGGGWTTTLVAALDKRINYSFPVAGSYPMFVRYQESSRNYGDFEQTFPQLYTKINYLDLYILGSTGEDRSQLQISNKYDPCCYGGEDYKKYDSFLKSHIESFEYGDFEVLSDSTHKEHQISNWALNQIFDKLNSVEYKKE